MSTETHTPRSAGTDLTGPTKPYNVRLTMSLVAAAMNKVQAAEADPPSLAELIDELLEGYVGRA